MSRQRKLIEKYCEVRGIEIDSLTWEPIGGGVEMCGPSGGWVLIDEDGEDYLGLNVSELLAAIDLGLSIRRHADTTFTFTNRTAIWKLANWLRDNLLSDVIRLSSKKYIEDEAVDIAIKLLEEYKSFKKSKR